MLRADFQGTLWQLCTSRWVIAPLTHTTRERLVCFFKTHKRSYIHTLFTEHLPTAHSACTRLATQFIHTHLLQKDLSSWGACMQARLCFMNFCEHKTMCMARGVSRVHKWQICVPPPVYCLHCHMLCVYIGGTTAALIQRLRKHFTTALAHSEDNRFHEQLRCIDLAEWLIVPLEIVSSSWEAAVAERYWWDKFHR